MENKKILYIAQEIAPYLPDSDLSTLCRNLPQRIQEKGYEVRTFMPKYGTINERRNQLHEVIRLSGMNIIIDDTDHQLIIKVATLLPSRMQVYFIDNDDYFQHHAVSDIEIRETPDDNDERSMFFVRGVIETVKKLRWEPSIINISGWVGALAPIYLKRIYNEDPSFRNSKIVVSLLNDGFDGGFDPRFVEKLAQDGFADGELNAIAEGPVDYKTLMKFAISHADAVVEAMPGADPELVEYAKNSGLPYMAYTGQEDAAAYIEFYKSL